ncbi:MAG TPA: rhodanese-like domain-containing protein [Bacteroidota bacterium]|nr:rhodanese-like domain-containing protein [Bacteroidota bacterium]
MHVLSLAILIMSTTGILASMQQTPPAIITPAEVQTRMEGDTAYVLLDVRRQEEFDGPLGHLHGAVLIPVQELTKRLDELSPHKQKTIVAVCRSGYRSGVATAILRDHGFAALNMVGGMIRWHAEGRAVIHTEIP